ncbi:hypothetical protein BBF96_09975 [Anoxybacter fermentans]|uniref:Inositolphosphotransferase Aur1/Ipt1 domain-containing protein n=1 Tax=Anoxybacter fermentans TaxID=1323375 RepID=A0A3S9SZH4_9FIRM|nr:phosphatase PAP2 family protein [Anoxybacter fermentans]AZR73684.1 hypothetical protein BBF96_09975 [Anoxybacter fermentans]
MFSRLFYRQNEKIILLFLSGLYLLISSLYPLFNHPKKFTFYFGIFLDNFVPFTPYWIIPYIIWYAYIPLVGFIIFLNNRKFYLKLILSFNIGVLICFVIYSIFQTTVPRPDVIGTDIFSQLVRIIYKNDLPYNCFPSIHVLTTYLCMKVIKKVEEIKKNLKIFFIIIGWLINLSTLFVKQHVFLDLVSGILLATLVFNLVSGLVERFYSVEAKSKC